MNLANSALRSIMLQVSRTRPDDYGIGYLRGQIIAIATFLDPDAELVTQAHAAVDALKKKAA